MGDNTILSISDRGQLTIPKEFRDGITVKHFICEFKNGTIVLKPLQTRDDFLAEIEAADKDWDENGGITLEEIGKKYNLKKKK